MKKNFILTILLILNLQNISFGQNIEIGQDAHIVKQLIEWSTNERRGTDSYGNSKGNNVEWNVKYYDGKISEVIQCSYNQLLYDLGVRATYCKHYMMSKGKLSHVLTQFDDLSVSTLKKKYDELYPHSKIDDLYLSNDFNTYSKIYLHKNGLATVEWRNIDMGKLSESTKTKINKQKEITEKQKIEKEKIRKDVNHLEKKQEPKLEEDYITYDDYKVLNVENILQRAEKESNISGIYQKNPNNELKIIELVENQVLFELNLFNGVNLGKLRGLITINNNSGVFEHTEFGLCKFQMNINSNKIELKTLDEGFDCGYGNGINNDGVFILKQKGIPELSE